MPRRHDLVVETLAIRPGDRVLEIGCGSGVVVNLVSRQLRSGKITAIDRSAAMTRHAIKRNMEQIAAGRAEIHCVPIESVTFPPARFNKIFSANVSLFWAASASAAATVGRIVKMLTPRGELFVFCERPEKNAAAVAERIGAALRQQGLAIATNTMHRWNDDALVCLSARRPR